MLSNQGRVFNIKADDLETCKPSEMGDFIPNLLDLNKNEKIIKVAIENQEIFILTAEGKGLVLNSNDMIGRTKQYIKLESAKFENNEVVGICEYNEIVNIKTQKKKTIEYNISDDKSIAEIYDKSTNIIYKNINHEPKLKPKIKVNQ